MEFVRGSEMSACDPRVLLDGAFLRELGRCMALDMMLNNFDRVPLVWTHAGNATNLLIEFREGDGKEGVEVLAVRPIDQAYTVIENETMRGEYINKVKACLGEARSAVTTRADSQLVGGVHAARLRSFFSSFAPEAPLAAPHLVLIFAGLVEMAEKMHADHARILESARKETMEAFKEAPGRVRREVDIRFAGEVAREAFGG